MVDFLVVLRLLVWNSRTPNTKKLLSCMDKSAFSKVLALLVAGVFIALAFLWGAGSYSSDLMATWLAGHFYGLGEFDQIYPKSNDVFTMLPPEKWGPLLENTPYAGPVFPFVYPPVWAALTSLIPDYQTFRGFATYASLVNSTLLAATAILAWRATRSRLNPAVYIVIVFIVLALTVVGSVALLENQPQILVSFLIVLAIERSRAGAQVLAGIALAIAAAIKIYPALFALFWLATGQKRAFGTFAITGGALGVFSILLVGWPLHQDFLGQLNAVSRTGLVTVISFNLNPFLTQLCCAAQMVKVHAFEVNQTSPPGTGWYYIALPGIWIWAMRLLLLATIAWLFRTMKNSNEQTLYAMIWPLATILIALQAPMAWSYYYIPAIAFLPSLIDSLGLRTGLSTILAVTLLLSLPLVQFFNAAQIATIGFQVVGTLTVGAMALAFYLASRRSRRQPVS